MGLLAWLLVGLSLAALLSRARPPLRRLPPAGAVVPPYALVWPAASAPPALEPAPFVVLRRLDEAPVTARLLVLEPGCVPAADLPARLAACADDFVSVFPEPLGRATAEEHWLRDFAGANRVAEAASSAAFADARCVWLRAADLALPGEGTEPLLRAARARKAHGLTVQLRSGAGGALRGPALGPAAWRAGLTDWTLGDPAVRLLAGALPVALAALTVVLLALPGTRSTALLAVVLGVFGRIWRAGQHGHGGLLAISGLWEEPRLAWLVWRHATPPPAPPFPELPNGPAPRLTGPQEALHGLDRRLDASAVLHLARRQGGSALVMEQLYSNQPTGRTPFGRMIDRWVQGSAGARALRWRRRQVAELGRALHPAALVSVPAGSGRDAAEINAPQCVLVDPDPTARALAARLCPQAAVLNGTVETTPGGPFDLCLYVGLAEYLDDAEVVRHLVLLRARLGPTGGLITSCTALHAEQRFMAERLGWKTRARRPDAYTQLLDAAGYRVELRSADPLGIQWVFLARPIGQRGSGSIPPSAGPTGAGGPTAAVSTT